MSNDDDIKLFLAQKRRALINSDMVWMAAQIPSRPSPDDPALILAFHRVRYHSRDIPDSYRHASARWLKTRGHTDMYGLPLLPDGRLPE